MKLQIRIIKKIDNKLVILPKIKKQSHPYPTPAALRKAKLIGLKSFKEECVKCNFKLNLRNWFQFCTNAKSKGHSC